jgi:hypothetical protein
MARHVKVNPYDGTSLIGSLDGKKYRSVELWRKILLDLQTMLVSASKPQAETILHNQIRAVKLLIAEMEAR